MGCGLGRQPAPNGTTEAVATTEQARANSPQSERSPSPLCSGSVGVSDLEAPITETSTPPRSTCSRTSRKALTVTSMVSSLKRSLLSGLLRQRKSPGEPSPSNSFGNSDHGDIQFSASTSRSSTRQREVEVLKSRFNPGPGKRPENSKMLTNAGSALITSKRLQTCQGMLDSLKEQKDEITDSNGKFQTAQNATFIPVCALHNSASSITTSPLPGTSVTAKDAKKNYTASEQNMPPLLVPIQNSSHNSTECGDALVKFRTADSEHIERSNALQSSNCVTAVDAKPTFVYHSNSEFNRNTIISTCATLESGHWVDDGITKTSSVLPMLSLTLSSLEDCGRNFGTPTPNLSPRLDESSLPQLEAEGKGTLQLLPQRADVAAGAATTVQYSRLNSVDNVMDDDSGACSQKLTAADVFSGAQLPAYPIFVGRSEHLVPLLGGRPNSANNSSSYWTMSCPLDFSKSNMDNEQELRSFDKKDIASESGTQFSDDAMSSSSEVYSQFGDLMHDTGQKGNTYKMSSPCRESPTELHSDNGDNGESYDNGDNSETASCGLNECAPQYHTNVDWVNIMLQLGNDNSQAQSIIAPASSSSTAEPGRMRPRVYKSMPQRLTASSLCGENKKIKTAVDEGSLTAAYFYGARRVSTTPQLAENTSCAVDRARKCADSL
eukprot:GEMP01012162.1.p1 GENE.GEMP01012162.1~~GEMP01012162.1.p1  ORF type:complete len:664 (+),score=100.08 GEMP01012162.1:271-2262(+)